MLALYERPQRLVVVSNEGCTSYRDGSCRSSVKLLPTCDQIASTSQRSLNTCWSAAFQNGVGPVIQPYVPNVLLTAPCFQAVSIGRRSEASRAVRIFAAQVFWKLKRLLAKGTNVTFQL